MIDQNARVACVILVCLGMVFSAGEIPIHATIDYQGIARQTQTIKEIGYENPRLGFDYQSYGVINSLSKQSQDIAQVALMKRLVLTRNKGPGNQRIMYGYALVSKLCMKRQKRELKYL
ncbi:hypothetical protein PRO82_002134 [Candidatus Protochlamydia amoebophila]|uniref:S-adenosylmethionine synthetase N-terminal domain-containing protein n=1 Tax=Candidatus Protochlamydia amoebophila TaxID=362787 RepID=UPI001BD89349|nr:S-adenosylmethionine synthetase N-terminal domain-containing protein [Candidatus Protochlamydia amoebophila]MBS4164801.1 hypothetical protein [Candidatus Protochlamydia amoebophila]